MHSHTKALVLFALALFLGLVYAAQSSKGAAEDAAAIFKHQCAACHGPDGAGKTAMGRTFKIQDLRSEQVQKLTDAQLFETIAKGKAKGRMPAYEARLGQARIHELVSYLREMAKNK